MQKVRKIKKNALQKRPMKSFKRKTLLRITLCPTDKWIRIRYKEAALLDSSRTSRTLIRRILDHRSRLGLLVQCMVLIRAAVAAPNRRKRSETSQLK